MAILCCFAGSAGAPQNDNVTGVVVDPGFSFTLPFRDIVAENQADESELYGEQESEDSQHRVPKEVVFGTEDRPQYSNDPKNVGPLG